MYSELVDLRKQNKSRHRFLGIAMYNTWAKRQGKKSKLYFGWNSRKSSVFKQKTLFFAKKNRSFSSIFSVQNQYNKTISNNTEISYSKYSQTTIKPYKNVNIIWLFAFSSMASMLQGIALTCYKRSWSITSVLRQNYIMICLGFTNN